MTNKKTETFDEEGLHFVIDEDELSEDDRVIIDIEEREVAIIKRDGEYYAFLNYCPHQGGPMGEGLISNKLVLNEGSEISDMEYDCGASVISCPWHGYEFDIDSGAHIHSSSYRLPSYEVVVQDGNVYIKG